jgi:hypothetical protein
VSAYPGDLVTLKQAADHLRCDISGDNDDLKMKIMQASSAIYTYLKSGVDLYLDSDGELDADNDENPLPYQIQAACLLMLGYLYKDRDGDSDKAYQPGYLPAPVTALLYPFRVPTLA